MTSGARVFRVLYRSIEGAIELPGEQGRGLEYLVVTLDIQCVLTGNSLFQEKGPFRSYLYREVDAALSTRACLNFAETNLDQVFDEIHLYGIL